MYMYTAKRYAADSVQCQPRYTYLTCTWARKRISRSSLVRHRHRHRHKYRVTNPKKRQSTADDIRVLVKHTNHKTGICPAVGNTAEGVWGGGERETKIVHPLYVRRNESHASFFFFCFSPPIQSSQSHKRGKQGFLPKRRYYLRRSACTTPRD